MMRPNEKTDVYLYRGIVDMRNYALPTIMQSGFGRGLILLGIAMT